MMRVHWNTYFSEYTNESRRGTSFSKTEFLSNVSGGSHAKTKKKKQCRQQGKAMKLGRNTVGSTIPGCIV